MVNSGTKPIFKLYSETYYKHLFLRQSNFGNNHWFKDARDQIFSSKTNQRMLTLSVPEKLKNSILGMPIITQTLNINNLRTTSATSINLHIIRKLVEYSLKNVWHRQCLFLPFSKYCCPKVGRYYDPLSGAQGSKGLR